MATDKTRKQIIDALMALAAERDWEGIGLEAVAARASVSLVRLRQAYDGRLDILADLARRTDQTVLAGLDPDMAEEAPRERLFDVLFARFEALLPYRPGLRGLAGGARRDPFLALALNRIAVTSMAWMLTAAGIPATGAVGAARAQGLALVWARVMRVWLDDDDPGLARTMAALDRRLREAERNF
ncbi:MAG TPA: TetR/AcrR family transcriptional regulator, partial [Afifellaceae bacterium]|nr:TetR/AcrR family transcriptional regulator [Afifellaceae bacterium]